MTTDATHWQLLESGEANKQLLAIGALLFEVRNELRQLRTGPQHAVGAGTGRPAGSVGAAAAMGAAAGYIAADVLAEPEIVAVEASSLDFGGFF